MGKRIAAVMILWTLLVTSAIAATDPVTTITSPTTATTYDTTVSPISLSGTVTPGSGTISRVNWWHAERGVGGTAVGTTTWAVSGIVLLEGSNRLSAWAVASDGRIGGDSIAITYTKPTDPPPTLQVPVMNPIVFTGSVTVNWRFPQTGGGTPTEYVLEATVPPSTSWAEVARTPYSGQTSAWSMSSMTLGTQYCFRVFAANPSGRSSPSNTVCATMNLGTGLTCVPDTCAKP